MRERCILLNGRLVAQEIESWLKEHIANNLSKHPYIRTPKLSIYTDGLDEASKVYLNNKKKSCKEVGINCDIVNIGTANRFDIDSNISNGVILQLPVKNKEQEKYFLNYVRHNGNYIDVDGLSTINQGYLYRNNKESYYNVPCTPQGIMYLLDYYNIDVESKNVVIIGRSNLVGKPLAMLMLNNNATITVCHSYTDFHDLSMYISEADILVSAVGKPNFISYDELKRGCVLVDVGINKDPNTGKLCGDVYGTDEQLNSVCSYRTPVPGGVGPMTVAMLLVNVYNSWCKLNNIDDLFKL